MIKKKNKIKVILTEDGSIKKIELPVKIHTGSVNMTDIEVFVPITVNRTSTSFVKIYGNTINEKGEKVWSSETYNINFKTIDVIDKFEYAVYEDKFPDEFSNISGDLNLTLAYADLDNEGSIIDVLPSQTIHLHVSGAGFNENGINISNYDATVARVNLLSELSIFKLDLSKELPLGIIFNKDGYKSPFYNFYTIEYTLPINASETAIKQCRVIANSIVKDSESPGVIGYQTEYAYFDGGICKRTNKYNISQGSVNNYVLLENGVWEIVNQGYITPIKLQVEQNSEDIEVLYRLVNTGSTPLGDYPSQDTVPTDSELNSFVQENFGREPQNGDELTFVLLVEDGTDIVYILKYSEVTQSWGKTALPSVEPAKNGSLGIIQGTSEEAISETRKVLVDINNGEINDILHNNENGEKESLSSQTNRNSQNIAINTKDISDTQENLNTEITRAKEEEQTIANNLSVEIERAKQAEQTNTTAIENEVKRATSKEEEKLDKVNINDNYIKDIVFSVNGDNGVANVELNNPVTGETKTIEITVTSPASSTNTGLMTANMVQALNNAIEDIESLKYIGKQVASFQTHAEAELFDFSTLSNVKINDYFIIQADESRTEPTENGKTTRYVCVNDDAPISLESFQFQGVVTTVNIQVATESKLGGVLSTNTEGYIYVENSGAMKLVGYDKIITNINNLISNITSEIERAKQAEESLNQAVTAETTRAQNVENNLQNVKADKTEIPTKLSELNNDSNYAKTEQIPTKTSQLTNDSNFATINQIPTKTSQIVNDGDGQDNTYTKLVIKDESEWLQYENVLPLGILCLDKTNMVLKISDGVNYWNNLPYFSQEKKITFADGTWEEISNAVNNGKAKDWFKIGDEKSITLSSGENLTVVIVGFDHDVLSNGGSKAGITIGLKGVLNTTYKMNSSNTNSGGWPNSSMCKDTMTTIFNKLPEDLQNVIKEVQKSSRTSYNNSSLVTTSNKLWLFSIAEIDGETNSNEGEQYEYYKEQQNRIKYSSTGSAQRWWTRSPSVMSNGSWCDIYTDGSSSSNSATSYSYVSFGFCI